MGLRREPLSRSAKIFPSVYERTLAFAEAFGDASMIGFEKHWKLDLGSLIFTREFQVEPDVLDASLQIEIDVV